MPDDLVECVFCSPHLVSDHIDGCTVEGCPCTYDADWYGDGPGEW